MQFYSSSTASRVPYLSSRTQAAGRAAERRGGAGPRRAELRRRLCGGREGTDGRREGERVSLEGRGRGREGEEGEERAVSKRGREVVGRRGRQGERGRGDGARPTGPTRLRAQLTEHWSHGPGRAGRLSGPGPKRPRAGSCGPWPDRKQRGGGAARHQSSRPGPGRRNGGSGMDYPSHGRRFGFQSAQIVVVFINIIFVVIVVTVLIIVILSSSFSLSLSADTDPISVSALEASGERARRAGSQEEGICKCAY